jgi:21S rRNA (uridine2791-2'-O)-methyltransferase
LSAADSAGLSEKDLEDVERGYIDIERGANLEGVDADAIGQPVVEDQATPAKKLTLKERDKQLGRVVDVVLSDMSEPWDQTTGFYKRSLSDPYSRMMNTSGIAFKDHAGSIVSSHWCSTHQT